MRLDAVGRGDFGGGDRRGTPRAASVCRGADDRSGPGRGDVSRRSRAHGSEQARGSVPEVRRELEARSALGTLVSLAPFATRRRRSKNRHRLGPSSKKRPPKPRPSGTTVRPLRGSMSRRSKPTFPDFGSRSIPRRKPSRISRSRSMAPLSAKPRGPRSFRSIQASTSSARAPTARRPWSTKVVTMPKGAGTTNMAVPVLADAPKEAPPPPPPAVVATRRGQHGKFATAGRIHPRRRGDRRAGRRQGVRRLRAHLEEQPQFPLHG